MSRSSPGSRAAILGELKLAAKKGDRMALARATERMKVWALSPRYWQKYLDLLSHPLARLVDLTVIKQGERIARQKGWVKAKREPARKGAPEVDRRQVRPPAKRAARRPAPAQEPLFPELP